MFNQDLSWQPHRHRIGWGGEELFFYYESTPFEVCAKKPVKARLFLSVECEDRFPAFLIGDKINELLPNLDRYLFWSPINKEERLLDLGNSSWQDREGDLEIGPVQALGTEGDEIMEKIKKYLVFIGQFAEHRRHGHIPCLIGYYRLIPDLVQELVFSPDLPDHLSDR